MKILHIPFLLHNIAYPWNFKNQNQCMKGIGIYELVLGFISAKVPFPCHSMQPPQNRLLYIGFYGGRGSIRDLGDARENSSHYLNPLPSKLLCSWCKSTVRGGACWELRKMTAKSCMLQDTHPWYASPLFPIVPTPPTYLHFCVRQGARIGQCHCFGWWIQNGCRWPTLCDAISNLYLVLQCLKGPDRIGLLD